MNTVRRITWLGFGLSAIAIAAAPGRVAIAFGVLGIVVSVYARMTEAKP